MEADLNSAVNRRNGFVHCDDRGHVFPPPEIVIDTMEAQAMSLEPFAPYLPWLAVAAGVLVLLWGQRARIGGWLAALRPGVTERLAPSERFERFYALRSWCQESGHAEAVRALDERVLPAIVREGGTAR